MRRSSASGSRPAPTRPADRPGSRHAPAARGRPGLRRGGIWRADRVDPRAVGLLLVVEARRPAPGVVAALPVARLAAALPVHLDRQPANEVNTPNRARFGPIAGPP